MNNVPPGYKQTEVGVIPEEWDVQPLGALVGYTNGKAHEQSINDSGRFVVVNSKFISTEGFTRKYSEHSFCPASKGDVLMVMSDVPNGRAIAKCYWVESDNTYTVNQRICILNPRGIDGKLLLYKLDRNPFYLAFDDGAKQTNLRKDEVLACPLGIPKSEAEQRAIATALSDVDGLLGGLDRLIAKKRDLKQAAMQQLLTGQTRLPGFHGEWELKRLGEVAIFLKGKGLPKSALIPFGAELCIHYGELFTRYPETIGEIMSRTNGSRDSFRSVANDVLMPSSDVTPRGLAKASCVTVDGVILGGDILVIRSDINCIFGPFLSYVIRREEDQVLQLVTGSTVFHLYGSDMKKFTFSIPPLLEQTAIAAVLTDTDAELAALDQRREKTCALKQGMMQELLTGRVRLIN